MCQTRRCTAGLFKDPPLVCPTGPSRAPLKKKKKATEAPEKSEQSVIPADYIAVVRQKILSTAIRLWKPIQRNLYYIYYTVKPNAMQLRSAIGE